MVLSYEGDPDVPGTYAAMEGLIALGEGHSPNVGGLGHVVSVNYTVHDGKRWDYAVLWHGFTAYPLLLHVPA